METKKLAVAGAAKTILRVVGKTVAECCAAVLRGVLKFDRKVLKRHFGIETPLYKFWWRKYAENMQKKLDMVHTDN